jgi:tripartite-type tricarboxylate transporter receptor subunit TctC
MNCAWYRGLFVSILLLFATTYEASAQAFPNRPIRLIVPFAAGGANDFVARLIQPGLERALGKPVVVENRTGASGIVGTDIVAKAAPDGHTIGVALASHSVNPAVNQKMPFDTEKDLAPIILVGKNPLMFLLNANVPARTVAEFVALVKANPEKYNYATPGAASQAHLVISQWANIAGVKLQHVPYRGGAPATLATIAGDTQFALISSLIAAPHIESGKLRAIAMGSLTRDKQFPDVPSMAESGYPDVEAVTWVGLFAPAGTPREIVERLNTEIGGILRDPEIAAKLNQQGITPAGGAPEILGTLVSAEIKRWTAVARQNGIAAEH